MVQKKGKKVRKSVAKKRGRAPRTKQARTQQEQKARRRFIAPSPAVQEASAESPPPPQNP